MIVEALLRLAGKDATAAKMLEGCPSFSAGELDPSCLEALLANDTRLVGDGGPWAEILHGPFTRDVLKVVAEKTPAAIGAKSSTSKAIRLYKLSLIY